MPGGNIEENTLGVVLGAHNGLRIWEGYIVGLVEVISVDLVVKILGTLLEAVDRSISFVEFLRVAAAVVARLSVSRGMLQD